MIRSNIVLAMVLALAVPVMAQPSTRPGPRRPQPPASTSGASIATTTPGLLCFTGCPTTSMLTMFVGSNGQCNVPVRYSCFPYRCEPAARACRTDCVSSGDCSSGAICNLATSECAPIGYECSDAFSVRSSDGTTASCSPYRCVAGACQSSCSDNLGCAEPTRCTGGRCAVPVVINRK
jgi:hypothetical protein